MRLAALLSILVFSVGAIAVEPIYSELDEGWRTDLVAKRQYVERLAMEHYQETVKRTPADIPLLQRILDDHLIPSSDVVALQALGVAFGDAIAAEIEADWKQVNDEYGENPILKIRNKRVAIGALTIISKRIEDKGAVDVIALHENLVKDLRRIQVEADSDGH